MNPTFVACSLGPTLTAFAKVRSRCTSTSKIGIPNCQPSGQQEALVVWWEGSHLKSWKFWSQRVFKKQFHTHTHISGMTSLEFDRWSLPDFGNKLMILQGDIYFLFKWPALGEARASGSSRTTGCVWKLRRTKWTGDQLQGGLRIFFF